MNQDQPSRRYEREFGKQKDQAWLLRKLAKAQTPSDQTVDSATNVCPQSTSPPYVTLLCELPAAQGICELAIEMAHLAATNNPTTNVLLADLCPAASRVQHLIASTPKLAGFQSRTQPLWEQSPHGCTLNLRNNQAPNRSPASCADLMGRLQVLAQPPGKTPTNQQTPRIYEQLVRRLGLIGPSGKLRSTGSFQQAFLLAESSVMALDQACWAVADCLVILTDANIPAAAIETQLLNRLPAIHPAQRVVIVEKQPLKLRHRMVRPKIEASSDSGLQFATLDLELTHLKMPWTHSHTRLRGGIRSAASALWKELQSTAHSSRPLSKAS